ncbi:MAG: sodium:calcium antiporter [Candidatus Micrarchaeota archaeon]|nr:sodium:calcium antiporter [Candidatus Micrarchaeota archaeon]
MNKGLLFVILMGVLYFGAKALHWEYYPVLEFVFAVSALVLAAEAFTEKAEKLGKMLRLSSFIVGVVILSLGTGMPEIASSIAAVVNGKSEAAFANAIGSNIASILLVGGISFALIKREYILKWDMLHGDVSFLLSTLLATGIVLLDGKVDFFESLILVLGYGLYLLYMRDVHRWSQEEKEEKHSEEKLTPMEGLVLLAALGVIAYSAELVVESLDGMAHLFKLPIAIVSLFALSIGTSLPEFLVSIAAARKGNLELALGNINGSNIFNIFAALGVSGLFGTINAPLEQFLVPYMFLFAATFSFILIFLDKKVHKYEGYLLIILYLFFALTMIRHSWQF